MLNTKLVLGRITISVCNPPPRPGCQTVINRLWVCIMYVTLHQARVPNGDQQAVCLTADCRAFKQRSSASPSHTHITHMPLTKKQCNMILSKSRWCPVVGKVTEGLLEVKGKASSLDIAPLTILDSGTLQPRKWLLIGTGCSTVAQASGCP